MLVLSAAGCEPLPLSESQTHFLALVSLVEAPEGVGVGDVYAYHVREVSWAFPIDTTISFAPHDTVVLDLPSATYDVELSGFPQNCELRHGAARRVVLAGSPLAERSKAKATAVVRYNMFCRPLATLITMTDGPIPDDRYVYRFIGPDGVETTGPIGINDTLRFDNLTPGPNTVELAHVAENCEVTSDGRRRQRVEIEPSGGGEIVFRVVCSDPERRPELLFFAASYEDGASGIVFRATDPNADIEQYYWDITDCAGTSVLPRGGRSRRGLYGDPRTRGEDTIQVVSAYEVGIPAEELQGRCTLLRVTDTGRNTTPAVEIPIRPPGGTPPFATSFNARFSGQTSLLVSLAVLDPDDDYVGSFAALRLRDGALGMSPDGEFDIGIYNSAGFGPNDDIPVVRLGEDQRLRVDQVFASIVYLFDARGNMTRLEDVDLFR